MSMFIHAGSHVELLTELEAHVRSFIQVRLSRVGSTSRTPSGTPSPVALTPAQKSQKILDESEAAKVRINILERENSALKKDNEGLKAGAPPRPCPWWSSLATAKPILALALSTL